MNYEDGNGDTISPRLFKMNQIKNPSTKPYVMDSAVTSELIPVPRIGLYPKLEKYSGTGDLQGIAYGRHNMDCNMLYLEGHVAAKRAWSLEHSAIGPNGWLNDYRYASPEIRRTYFAAIPEDL